MCPPPSGLCRRPPEPDHPEDAAARPRAHRTPPGSLRLLRQNLQRLERIRPIGTCSAPLPWSNSSCYCTVRGLSRVIGRNHVRALYGSGPQIEDSAREGGDPKAIPSAHCGGCASLGIERNNDPAKPQELQLFFVFGELRGVRVLPFRPNSLRISSKLIPPFS